MDESSLQALQQVMERFGYIVIGSNALYPVGHIFRKVARGTSGIIHRLPQPFAIIAQADHQDWRRQVQLCESLRPMHAGESDIECRYYYRCTTD